MARTIFVRANDEGFIVTWGDEFLDNAVEVSSVPDDWNVMNVSKYVLIGSSLIVRDGWVDPVEEPES